MHSTSTATVVGSGPNGLAAALILARAGMAVTVLEEKNTPGGGLRSGKIFTSDVVHDHCSAAFPLAQASPFFQEFGQDLAAHGLRFGTAPIDAVHILAGRRSAALHRSSIRTGVGFSTDQRDARRWKTTFGHFSTHAEQLAEEFLRPPLHLPRHPLLFASFGLHAALPASQLWRRFRTPEAQALFAGIAAHAFTPLDLPGSSAAGMLLTTLGHRFGWPVAIGGSQSIATALIAELTATGGQVLTTHPVSDIEQIPRSDLILLDTSVETAASILGNHLPHSVARAWSQFRRGPAVAKIDYLLEGDIPWTSMDARRAGTVHLGGGAEDIASAEQSCWRGQLPRRPFTLVGQQYLADPSRSTLHKGRHINPLWAYAHVPANWNGSDRETFDLVTTQIEREAPGFRDQILDWTASPPAMVEANNRNDLGGDIAGGANDLRQLLARPRLRSPYDTGIPGVYLCSSSTAPGGGVHFMCGMNAAQYALRQSGHHTTRRQSRS